MIHKTKQQLMIIQKILIIKQTILQTIRMTQLQIIKQILLNHKMILLKIPHQIKIITLIQILLIALLIILLLMTWMMKQIA